MKSTSVSFAESALADLQAIRQWYQDEGVPEIGIRFVTDIIDKTQHLASHPEMGRIVQEFDLSFLRELIHPPFRIVYRRDAGQIKVVRVWRSERLLELPGEE
ncbi:type II toxin-antitoxin system RelE/ParE family toxin [Thiohalophilus sp.]|uniref:type II toxin-antitoxin system RelE/ParE family toxin n=1 Tax=Thiohalophilus sp. TaxID=3028392 RepID=UPI002ACEFC1C|nr:type II toxin-antitoxin system RelE/ParE family toxin [Thiohalophilus sp.]MDZ7662989.1 type II toxin-antitoxin system RelE/ParE family toxin [Thiohalophilus sp.]